MNHKINIILLLIVLALFGSGCGKNEESKEKQYDMFRFLNMMNFWVFGWGALGIVFCSGDLVQLCFGIEYVMGLEVPLVMAINFYTVGMMNAVWIYKHTLGLFRYGRFLQIGTGILNIFFSVILGNRWGLVGILIATTMARACTNLWYDPYVVMKHGFFQAPVRYLKRYVQNLGVLLIAGSICWFVFQFVKGPILVQAVAKVILCSIIANAVFFATFCRTREYEKLKEFMRNVVRIVLK